MNANTRHQYLFYKLIADRIRSLCRPYVDGISRAGTPEFVTESTSSTRTKFQPKPQKTPLDFSSKRIYRHKNFRHTCNERFINRLEFMSPFATFDEVRSIRAKLSWVFNTSSDICAAVAPLRCHQVIRNLSALGLKNLPTM